jgi:hypothetical protein
VRRVEDSCISYVAFLLSIFAFILARTRSFLGNVRMEMKGKKCLVCQARFAFAQDYDKTILNKPISLFGC